MPNRHQRRHQLCPQGSPLFQVGSCTVSSRPNLSSEGALCPTSEGDFCPQTSTSCATPLPRLPARSTAPPVVSPVPPAVTYQQRTGNQRERLHRTKTAAKKAAANYGVAAALNTANLAAIFPLCVNAVIDLITGSSLVYEEPHSSPDAAAWIQASIPNVPSTHHILNAEQSTVHRPRRLNPPRRPRHPCISPDTRNKGNRRSRHPSPELLS
jgi:hypothetical protein